MCLTMSEPFIASWRARFRLEKRCLGLAIYRLLTISAAVATVAWGGPASAQTEGAVQVFDVGKDVYVRSLAVDRERGRNG